MSNATENPMDKTNKTTPERPSENSINNNIKEKLNLHVKRRLQESGADISLLNNNTITKNNNTSNNNNNNNTPEVKVRKQYTKRIEKANNPTVARRTKRTKLKQPTTTTTTTTGPGTIVNTCNTVSQRDSESFGSLASTSTTTTTASAGDDEGSRDGNNSQNPDILHSPREKEKCPDLLSVVLNVKKRALFQNPEVIGFLQNMMDVLRQ